MSAARGGFPPLKPPPRPHSPTGSRTPSQSSFRSDSSLSTASNDSSQPALLPPRTTSSYFGQQPVRPSTSGGRPLPPPARPAEPRYPVRASIDGGLTPRTTSLGMGGQQLRGHARQHSQGFFEPSLPTANAGSSSMSASQIAAQAAFQFTSPPASVNNERKRSYPGLAPINTGPGPAARRSPSEVYSPQMASAGGLPPHRGAAGANSLAATTAANVAFPVGRSPLPSPGLPPAPQSFPRGAPPEKETKAKSSKMKLFSKPKNLALSKEKESRVTPAMPSPGKSSIASALTRTGFSNQSVTSLAETIGPANSIYSSANVSTSTLVPVSTEKEKEKRQNFFTKQKSKLKDEPPPQLSLSSAHSNSEATNPEKPQPLYSFVPDSPGTSTFSKTMSGFDLRHGGRALREKKKEEKAARMDLTTITSNISSGGVSDQFGPSSYETLGPPTNASTMFPPPSDTLPAISAQQLNTVGASMGLSGIGLDDAWPLLKARLLNLFSGEELRTPIEDFNTLVGVHIRRCVQRKSPVILVEDLRELLQTGFGSLAQTLRGIPDDRLVTKLVEMWIGVYSSILPFLQAVFLPMDLEFKGRGQIMTVKEAQEFWGAMPESLKSDERPSSTGGTIRMPTLGEELDVRRITLITFRDVVILPRHEGLMAIFSRLSLESINATASPELTAAGRQHARSDPATTGAERPGTAGSLSPHMSSFNSQGSTLLDAASSSSGGAMSLASRSRATSNTSAGSFGTSLQPINSPTGMQGSFSATAQPISPQPTFTDPTTITETVARMLQCLYVLASCQTGDVGQGVVERLTGALKYNWLGRGRTGRDRRGWVGMRNPPSQRIGLVGA